MGPIVASKHLTGIYLQILKLSGRTRRMYGIECIIQDEVKRDHLLLHRRIKDGLSNEEAGN